ncbi:MAG: VOC family protein [Rhodanobacteraceae bacterium]|nr:VOC family protein [Rhodanobacteraceae bacterium]
MNPNVPAWFEIPTLDLDRAQRYYETILGTTLARERIGAAEFAMFPYAGQPNTTGALLRMDDCEPSVQGSTIYLSVADVRAVLERIAAQGSDVFVPCTELPGGMGWFAQFRDCEGNRVGLWSPA